LPSMSNKISLKILWGAGTLLALCCLEAAAQEPGITKEIREISNDIIIKTYHDIAAQKGQYDDLAAFGEDVLYENNHGIYALVYEPQGTQKPGAQAGYAFGLSVTGLEGDLFQDQKGCFHTPFPYLGVKIVGYQPRYLKASQFDLMKLVKKNAQRLADRQQAYLPLRLSIEPVKNTFRVGEDILFDVALTNVTKNHMFVKDLGPSTLYFLLNNARWGTRPEAYNSKGERVILRTGETLRVRFRGEGYLRPRQISIYGVYHVPFKGVKPFARAQIQIVE